MKLPYSFVLTIYPVLSLPVPRAVSVPFSTVQGAVTVPASPLKSRHPSSVLPSNNNVQPSAISSSVSLLSAGLQPEINNPDIRIISHK